MVPLPKNHADMPRQSSRECACGQTACPHACKAFCDTSSDSPVPVRYVATARNRHERRVESRKMKSWGWKR